MKIKGKEWLIRMKIKDISCTQFAGIRDRKVSFEDGINIVYGKNESGKSTLVNMISRTLFQNVKLDGRSDKEFMELYFPGASKEGNFVGDSVDGEVVFEAEKGEYYLSKVWGADAHCKLATPEGVMRDQKKVDMVLKEALVYGEGVYSELLFSSQKNTDISLQNILDAAKKTESKKEILDAVSKAFVESDGITMEAIEQAINGKIEEIAGKHWDLEREVPVRKSGSGRWASGLGEILKAYYTLEDAKAVLEEIAKLEKEAENSAAEYLVQDEKVQDAEAEFHKFNSFASQLEVRSERTKTVARINKELEKIGEVLKLWPVLSEELEKARKLQKEREERIKLDKYEEAKEVALALEKWERENEKLLCPLEEEISQVKKAQRNIPVYENKLCGMNLNAVIHMFEGNEVEIISLRTGQKLEVTEDGVALTEAAKITVPGVMEMQLAPTNVDVNMIEEVVAKLKKDVEEVFLRYQVSSLEELESLTKKSDEVKNNKQMAKNKLAMILGNISFEELESSIKEIDSKVPSKEEIEKKIQEEFSTGDVVRIITAKETILEGYCSEYGSVNDLKAKAYDFDMELRKAKELMIVSNDIPEKYLKIKDPQAYLEELQTNLKGKQAQREQALNAKTAAVSKLETYKENITEEPAEMVEKAERSLEEQKSLLRHWLHIQEVFKAQKETVQDNPMEDIAEHFTNYLEKISDGSISSEFPEADKLNMRVYSKNRLLDYGKLSEGTKETVSLAFRLAVLEHLFPEGNGVIVFDDPFTDMDAERTAASLELIKECAKRHQVIFLTCKEEYLDKLDGKVIRV